MPQSIQFSLVMTAAPTLTNTTTALPNAVVGQAYSFQLTASGGVTPYHWSATNLIPGITLSDSGLLSGQPTVNEVLTGHYTLTDSGS